MSTNTREVTTPKEVLAKKMLLGFKFQDAAGSLSLIKTCTVKGGSCKGGSMPPSAAE